jgi:thioesterase domain-containing protein
VVPVVLAVVLFVGCGGQSHAPEKAHPRPEVAPVGVSSGEMVDVGGRHLYVECVGSGSPTVVLEAGFGGSSRNWTAVLPELGRTSRTCAYDRAGLGNSDAMPGVHDAGDQIRDLERLLDRGQIEPPYVLVGHSYGGLLARLFARAHPDETGGVVLVDAEGRDLGRREPLIVITAARERELDLFRDRPPEVYRRWNRVWRAMQTELAGLSSDHAHVVALRSDHFIQDDQPLVVIQAIRTVVRAVRDHTQLPPCDRVLGGPDVRCLS